MFQSSAGHKPGRYASSCNSAEDISRFNPRPGINPAATRRIPVLLLSFLFQSSAGHKPGRYSVKLTEYGEVLGFNPRPGINPAATWLASMWRIMASCFNPRPGINPAATATHV